MLGHFILCIRGDVFIIYLIYVYFIYIYDLKRQRNIILLFYKKVTGYLCRGQVYNVQREGVKSGKNTECRGQVCRVYNVEFRTVAVCP